MFELVIMMRSGVRHSVAVRDWREANVELANFVRNYVKSHANDEIINAGVFNRRGEIVSRYNRGRLEIF